MFIAAAPTFERRGVITGFVLGTGVGLRPSITRGVLFAQGLMYRPSSAPVLPLAPDDAQSWLFYSSSTGFYWRNVPSPASASDAALGWVVARGGAIVAVSAQSIWIPDADVETTVLPVGPVIPQGPGPETGIDIPGDLQPIDGAPFVMTPAEDGTTCRFSIEYKPPASLVGFQGVRMHWVRDGQTAPSCSDDADYNGTAGGHGTCVLEVLQDREADRPGRVYLTTRSATYVRPLILNGLPGASPSVPAVVHKAAVAALTPPPLPVSVTVAEKPGSRRLAPNQDGAYVTWFTLRVTVQLPDEPVEGEWVEIRISENNTDWAGPWEFPITQQTESFDIDGWVVPAHGGQFWAKALTNAPSGINSPADAVECAAPAEIAGLADPAANAVTGAEVTYKERKTLDGLRLWGPVARWTNPTAEQEPNFWTTMLRISWVNASGQPNPEYGEAAFEYSAEITNEATPGLLVIHDNGQNWLFPEEDDPYPIPRFTIWVRNRAGGAVKQNCWPGGADHYDLSLTLPPPSLRVDRSDVNRMLGLHVSGGKLQPKTGQGVALSADRLIANVGGVLGFDGNGQIRLNVGWGVMDYYGVLYARVAQGLGFDAGGNVQIPTFGVGQNLLANSQIIDAGRLVDYAVSQMKLQNAQIINSARLVDLAVLTAKLGFGAVGAAQIADAAINTAKIAELSVSKLTAGTAVFSGDVMIQNSGIIDLHAGGMVYARRLSGQSFDTNLGTGGYAWLISSYDAPPRITNYGQTSYVLAGGYWVNTVSPGVGQSVSIGYKKADGSNGTLNFNGGILTSYT